MRDSNPYQNLEGNFYFFSIFCSVSPPKQLFVERSPAPSTAPAAQDQGMSIPVIGSSESFFH